MVILFNKPFGVLCQFSGEERPTLRSFGFPPRVYPAGRLDHDSEGLLLLSDEARVITRLLDPARAHKRQYWVQLEGIPDAGALARLAEGGLIIQGHKLLPAEVKLLPVSPELWPRDPPIRFRQTIPTSWVELTLREGKNRQIRRMTAAVGYPTLRLIRVSMGPYTLGRLLPGQWQEAKRQPSPEPSQRRRGPRATPDPGRLKTLR